MNETSLTQKLLWYYTRYANAKDNAWCIIYEMKFKELMQYIKDTERKEGE